MLGGHELLLDHVVGDLHVGQRRPLAVARLKHVKLLLLHRELEVLDVAKLLLQLLADLLELLVGVGKLRVVRHLDDRLRRPDAGHDVFPLGVDEVFAVEDILAGGRVAGEGHAGSAVIPHVAKHHALDVDGGAPLVGDLVLATVDDRALVHPAAEDGSDGSDELLEGILREGLPGALLDELLEAADEILEVILGECGVFLDVGLVLDLLHHFFERVMLVLVALLHPHHDVAVHLDEAAVGIEGEAAIAGGLLQALDGLVVEAEIQDRVHHPRHAVAGTGADAHQQRVGRVAELLPGLLLEQLHVVGDLLLEPLGELLPRGVVIDAHLRRDREARGNRKPDLRHLREIRPLAANDRLHGAVAVAPVNAEVIDHPPRLRRGGLLGGRLLHGRFGHGGDVTFRGGGNRRKKGGKPGRIYVDVSRASTRRPGGLAGGGREGPGRGKRLVFPDMHGARARGGGAFPAAGCRAAPAGGRSAPLPRRVGPADRPLHHPGRDRKRLVVRHLAGLHRAGGDVLQQRPIDATEAELTERHR